jgi:hypothetical protein
MHMHMHMHIHVHMHMHSRTFADTNACMTNGALHEYMLSK